MHQAPESEAAQTHQLIEPQSKHLRSHPDNIPTSCPLAPPFLRVPSLGIPPWCHCHSQITPTTLPPREHSTQISPAGILLDIPPDLSRRGVRASPGRLGSSLSLSWSEGRSPCLRANEEVVSFTGVQLRPAQPSSQYCSKN